MAKPGIGVKVSYKTLHKEMGKLQKQLKQVRTLRQRAGLSVVRVNFVMRSLSRARADTMCQINMLENF